MGPLKPPACCHALTLLTSTCSVLHASRPGMVPPRWRPGLNIRDDPRSSMTSLVANFGRYIDRFGCRFSPHLENTHVFFEPRSRGASNLRWSFNEPPAAQVGQSSASSGAGVSSSTGRLWMLGEVERSMIQARISVYRHFRKVSLFDRTVFRCSPSLLKQTTCQH